jgi:hypothetical protein
VRTNIFEKAGCAMSEAWEPSTSSAYEVISISRSRNEPFVRDSRRISASSSGETCTSSVLMTSPSVRMISARSSVKLTS